MFKITDIVEIQGQSECVTEKIVCDSKESTENINDRSEKKVCFSWRSPELHQIKQLLLPLSQI